MHEYSYRSRDVRNNDNNRLKYGGEQHHLSDWREEMTAHTGAKKTRKSKKIRGTPLFPITPSKLPSYGYQLPWESLAEKKKACLNPHRSPLLAYQYLSSMFL
jgi:hypothetical protein